MRVWNVATSSTAARWGSSTRCAPITLFLPSTFAPASSSVLLRHTNSRSVDSVAQAREKLGQAVPGAMDGLRKMMPTDLNLGISDAVKSAVAGSMHTLTGATEEALGKVLGSWKASVAPLAESVTTTLGSLQSEFSASRAEIHRVLGSTMSTIRSEVANSTAAAASAVADSVQAVLRPVVVNGVNGFVILLLLLLAILFLLFATNVGAWIPPLGSLAFTAALLILLATAGAALLWAYSGAETLHAILALAWSHRETIAFVLAALLVANVLLDAYCCVRKCLAPKPSPPATRADVEKSHADLLAEVRALRAELRALLGTPASVPAPTVVDEEARDVTRPAPARGSPKGKTGGGEGGSASAAPVRSEEDSPKEDKKRV